MTPEATISITRPREWFGRFRKLGVLVDREVVARLKIGETVDLEVAPGQHLLQVKMDWCTSQEVQVCLEAGVHRRFICRSPGPWRASKMVFSCPHSLFELVPAEEAN